MDWKERLKHVGDLLAVHGFAEALTILFGISCISAMGATVALAWKSLTGGTGPESLHAALDMGGKFFILLLALWGFAFVVVRAWIRATRPRVVYALPQPNSNLGVVIHSATWGMGQIRDDVTETVRKRIRDGRLTLDIKWREFPRDPCLGIGKELVLCYSFGGVKCQVTLPENSVFELPLVVQDLA